ncbi:hypothetical protein D3C81_1577520 [compost metagenome]
MGGLLAIDHDRAGAPADHAHDRLEDRAAAGTIAPEQGNQLAAAHPQVDAMQDVRLAVEGVDVGQAQLFLLQGKVLSHG